MPAIQRLLLSLAYPLVCLALGATVALASDALASDGPSGAALYSQHCADCHGAQGQGTDYHRPTLTGDLPVRELTRVITETMPEGEPEACVGAEAEAIARYVHGAFYSPLAQARIRPPRRELSRLTVRQLQQSYADLLSDFSRRYTPGEERGLKSRFQTKVNVGAVGPRQELDLPRIDFLLSEIEDLPDSYRYPKEAEEGRRGNKRLDVYVDVWGGLIAPKTGDYQFSVESDAAVQLTINDTPVIDVKIRSAGDPILRGNLRLIGGRAYSLRLNSSRVRSEDLRLALRWRPPGGIEEVIPNRYLLPEVGPYVHATTVKFPPDDRSVGYMRGANVSADWDEASTAAALEFAEAVLEDLPRLARRPGGEKIESADSITPAQAIDFCERFAAVAFRRPPTPEEKAVLIERCFQQGPDTPTTAESIELALLSILKSPRFLYPEASLALASPDLHDDYAIATRLALGLWDSLPDTRLRKSAERGHLSQENQVRQRAERMLLDQRTRSKLSEFFEHWLRLDHAGKLSRDPARFPDFNDRIAADMRASLEMLLDEVVWRGSGDLRELFLSEELFVNKRLADFLGLEFGGDEPERFVRSRAETRERAGVVSHPFIVTAFSYYRDTSPIHRGVFLARNVLGRSLRPPPEAVAPLAPELAPDMTTRERVAAQTSPGACQACHVLINDLGFTLENFDAVGRYREREIGRPIDATGGYIATDGGTVRLAGSHDLARFLADSEDVHRSFVTQLFEHVTKQPILAYGVETRERLLEGFRESDFNIRELLVEIAVVSARAN
ncbi:PA14 domain protein [Planctomycetes bacterium MalM25]|nr:PA14 domain protein [Planctomycetes bacterium MalM25]